MDYILVSFQIQPTCNNSMLWGENFRNLKVQFTWKETRPMVRSLTRGRQYICIYLCGEILLQVITGYMDHQQPKEGRGGGGEDKGELYHLLPKFEHIFVAVITFPPFLLCRFFYYQLVAYCVCFKMICEMSL